MMMATNQVKVTEAQRVDSCETLNDGDKVQLKILQVQTEGAAGPRPGDSTDSTAGDSGPYKTTNLQTPGPKGLQTPGPKGLQTPGPKGLQTPGPKGLQTPGPKGLQTPGPKGLQTPGPKGLQTPGPKGLQTPGPNVKAPQPPASTLTPPQTPGPNVTGHQPIASKAPQPPASTASTLTPPQTPGPNVTGHQPIASKAPQPPASTASTLTPPQTPGPNVTGHQPIASKAPQPPASTASTLTPPQTPASTAGASGPYKAPTSHQTPASTAPQPLASIPVRLVAKVPPPGGVVAKVPPPGGVVAKVPPPGGAVAKVPPPGGAVAKVPPPGGAVAKVPPPGGAVAKAPPPGGAVAKVPPPGGAVAKVQPQVKLSPSIKQAAPPGRTVVITVPRAAAPQPVAPQPRPAPPQLPANIQIPAGMMLIRSDSGQLIFVSQQALSQAQQQTPRGVTAQTPRVLVPQVSAAAGSKSTEKVTLIRMAAPAQKTAVVKVINVTKPAVVQTVSAAPERGNSQTHVRTVVTATKDTPTAMNQATLDSVKKCKNFLVTLIKLASSDSRSATMANNVRGLVAALLEGKLEAEEFTERLYQELNSTPQPCLVPFLKKSLPAVRRLTPDPKVFIQQASNSSLGKATGSVSTQQVNQQPRGLVTSVQTRAAPKHTVTPGKHLAGSLPVKSFSRDSPHSSKFTFSHSSGSYKEDDDINDVASMAGVNLKEENAHIFTSVVGSVVQSCQDQLFLSAPPLLGRILHTGEALGVRDVSPDVVALLSHATQECLRGFLEKLSVMAEHRRAGLKDDSWHTKVSDVRSQLRFLEEVESLKNKRREEEERERLLQLARSRSHTEDPHQQQLKQRAKEFQQLEAAEQLHREANITALAAIGPRRKRPAEQTENTVCVLSRQGVHRVTRVMLRDLLLCMEQNRCLHHSLTLYKAML